MTDWDQAGERIQLPRTEQECITLLHQEQKELKELINKDRKLRQEDQETQSTAYMFDDPKSKHKAQII